MAQVVWGVVHCVHTGLSSKAAVTSCMPQGERGRKHLGIMTCFISNYFLVFTCSEICYCHFFSHGRQFKTLGGGLYKSFYIHFRSMGFTSQYKKGWQVGFLPSPYSPTKYILERLLHTTAVLYTSESSWIVKPYWRTCFLYHWTILIHHNLHSQFCIVHLFPKFQRTLL